MAVRDEDMAEIETVLAECDSGSGAVAAMRARLPHLSCTRCDASDVDEEPFRSFGRFDVHLLDARDHCVRITGDPQQATGIVLATRS
ncbi:MAG: hypothetical protein Kow0026_19920 [Oricola sp.]